MSIITNPEGFRFRYTVKLKNKVSKQYVDDFIQAITYGTSETISYEIKNDIIKTSSQKLASRVSTADTLNISKIKQIQNKRKLRRKQGNYV